MTKEKKQTQPGIGKTVLLPGCSGCGLGCLGTLLLCLAAMTLGFAIVPFNTAFLGGVAGFVVVLATAIVARIKGRSPPWRVFFGEIVIIAALLLGFFLWDTPWYVYRCVLGDPIPSSVKIIRAEYEEHPMDPSAWMHIKISPSDLPSVIAKNNLTPDHHPPKDRYALNTQPAWWKPLEFGANARLFKKDGYRTDYTGSISYVVGIWVNEETNEVYGYYINF